LHAEELTRQAEEAREETEESARQMQKFAAAEAALRGKADEKRKAAEHNHEVARLNLADLAIDRGLALCERDNDLRRGLLWMARGLDLAQVTSPPLKARGAAVDRAARLGLAAWMERLPARVVLVLPHPRGVECAAFRPDGLEILTGSADG